MAKGSYWQRIQRERISRRRLIGTAGAGAAGLAVVAACGGGATDTPTAGTPTVSGTPAGTPKVGGRWQATSNADFGSLDPHTSVAGAVEYFPRIYNVLIKQSPQDAEFIVHDLAESFEAPEPGGTEWIFHIRPGVNIAPNDLGVPERPMDAEDARVSFERIRNLPEAGACSFVCEWFDSHEAPDPETYIIRTPKPYAWFQVQVGGTQFWSTIPPRELIEQDPARMLTNAVGGGPFSVPQGGYSEASFLTLDRNPNYYGTDPDNSNAQLPYIDGWDISIVPDVTAMRVAFESKQSYSYDAASRAEAEELLRRYDIHEGVRNPLFSFISFAMNVERPPWDNPDVRKAAMHAINRQEYIDRIYGGEAQANGLVAWPLEAYALSQEELDERQQYDVELSKQLLRGAGFELPVPIKVMFPAGDFLELGDHLPIWLVQMEEAGFKVEQDQQALGVWIENMNNVNYDATLKPNRADETPEFPLDYHHSLGPSGNGLFSNGLQDDDVDAAIEASKEITDAEELVDAIQNVQRLIYDKGPVHLPIVSAFSRTLVWNFVKNFPTTGGTADLLLNNWWLDGAPS